MKTKKILRFYFRAEKLDSALNNLINKSAFTPCSDAMRAVQRIDAVISEKMKLAAFWEYLDGIMKRLEEEDTAQLAYYADMRCGLSSVDGDGRKAVRRAVVKFTRKALRIESFAEGIALVGKYYCLL